MKTRNDVSTATGSVVVAVFPRSAMEYVLEGFIDACKVQNQSCDLRRAGDMRVSHSRHYPLSHTQARLAKLACHFRVQGECDDLESARFVFALQEKSQETEQVRAHSPAKGKARAFAPLCCFHKRLTYSPATKCVR